MGCNNRVRFLCVFLQRTRAVKTVWPKRTDQNVQTKDNDKPLPGAFSEE